ncbi:MAG: hypothetical protein HeimC2_23660 [Candidatus Heimdallarchaeota archaeon LC_2]|nr:MAG: hypothetical protein HeimC2_23660 [Candidatus Heimdallarchaeota archaeon LC_2]
MNIQLRENLIESFMELFQYVTNNKKQTHKKIPQWNNNPEYFNDQSKIQNITLFDQAQETFWNIVFLVRKERGSAFLTGNEIRDLLWDHIFIIVNDEHEILDNKNEIGKVVDQFIEMTNKQTTKWEVIISIEDVELKDDLTLNESERLIYISDDQKSNNKWITRLNNLFYLKSDARMKQAFMNRNYAEIVVFANHQDIAMKKALTKLKKLMTIVNLIYNTQFIITRNSQWRMDPQVNIFAYDKGNQKGFVSFQRLASINFQLEIGKTKDQFLEKIYNWNHYLDSIEIQNNQFLQKIDLVIKWYGNLLKSQDIDTQILFCCTILETLLTRKKEDGTKKALIAFRISIFYFRSEYQKYIETSDWLDLYRQRNQVIHGTRSYEMIQHEYNTEYVVEEEPYREHTRMMVNRVGKLIYDVYSTFYNLHKNRNKDGLTEFQTIDQFINWIDNRNDEVLIDGIKIFANDDGFKSLWNNKNQYRSEFLNARKQIKRTS